MSLNAATIDTIHLIVKSRYVIAIVNNTNLNQLTVNHYVETDSVVVRNEVEKYDVIKAYLHTDKHHNNGDQMIHSNGIVDLIIEYQILYHS